MTPSRTDGGFDAEIIGGGFRRPGGLRVSHRRTDPLEVLEPRLLARLVALACAPIDRADTLTSDLSWGRFDRKWGALTPALWLEMEVSAFPEAPRTFVSAGPDGIGALAERRMAPGYRAVVKEIRETAERCAGS